MQLISIDCQSITPSILREVADIYETTGVEHHKSPIKYNIWQTPKDILDDHYEDIENDADTARDELNDVVIWLKGLSDFFDEAIEQLNTKYPNDNIEWYFNDIKEYHTIISKHANDARKAVIDINLAIDPNYPCVDLPKYTAIT